jgi:hypothetical protein
VKNIDDATVKNGNDDLNNDEQSGCRHLGDEIIWGNSNVSRTHVRNADNFRDLRQSPGNLIPPGAPALFCIAENKVALVKRTVPQVIPIKKWDDLLAKYDATQVNKRSIVLALVDSDDEMIHYLGGDADYEIESRIAAWFNAMSPE